MAETYHGFIDTAHDALLIFEACNNGFLSRVQRRFSDRERQNIRSGAVYVWDEEETGMRRWTDGRTWSPSRVHGCFLIYYEIEGRRHQFINKNTTNNGSSSRNSPRSGQIESSPFQSYDLCPPNIMQKKQGLIKKALSLCTNDKRRLHLVCYYSREDLKAGCLGSPTNDSRFAGIQVFEDRYPEIGHGMGRAERYGNGRGRASAETRPWDPTLPEAPIVTRNGPPAYVRSSMTIEKRSRSYRNEVFRYPNYGPYAGPVRHVNAPTLQGPSSYPSQGYQHNGDDNDANPQGTPFPGVQPTPIPRSYTPSAAVESTPSMVKLSGAMPTHGSQRQLHVPKLQLNALTPASVHYSVRAPTYEIGRGSTDFQPTGAGAAYGSHAYSYPSSMWKTAPMPSGSTFAGQNYYNSQTHDSQYHHHHHQQQQSGQPLAHGSARLPSASHFLPVGQLSVEPSLQYDERPRIHPGDNHHRFYNPSAAGVHNSSTNGLMIHMDNSSSSVISRTDTDRPHHQQAATSTRRDSTVVRLPSIEKLDGTPAAATAAADQSLNAPWKQQPTSIAVAADGVPRMNSEDMRQLASLRPRLN